MAWIESHQSLGTHIKLRRLARALGVHRAQAVGHLHYLWWWALDSAPSGDLSGLASIEIAEFADWPGDPEMFVAALRDCGWLDPDGRIHDWRNYVGKILAYREANRKRQSRQRAKRRNAGIAPPSRAHNGDVTPPSRPDNGYVRGRQCTGTVPVPTGTNQPVPYPTVTACASLGVDTPPEGTHAKDAHADSSWPSLGEVQTRAELRGIPKDCAEKWWHEHDARGGCDRHGQPLKRWESALIAFATSWRSVENQKAARKDSGPQRNEPIDHSKGFFG